MSTFENKKVPYHITDIVERVWARHYRRWWLLDPDDAKQEAILVCLRRADNWNGALSSAPTYFSMVATHAIQQAHIREMRHVNRTSLYINRESQKEKDFDIQDPTTDESVEDAEIASRVRCVVSSLPPLIQDLIASDGDVDAKKSIVEAAGISRQAGDKRLKKALVSATRHLRRLI